MSDDAYESYNARESFPPLASSVSFSEHQSADSVHSVSRVSFSAQQDSFPGYDSSISEHPPYSPVPDPAHPWEDPPPPSYDLNQVETTAIQQEDCNSNLASTRADSQENTIARPCCEQCNKSFSEERGLERHVQTIHGRSEGDWVCPVKTCGKRYKKVNRIDNFRRHCRRKHPLMDLKEFGL